MSGYREIVKLLAANTGAKRMSEVFDNFVEMAALALRNAVDVRGSEAWEAREAQYLQIAGHYSRTNLDRFAHALALVTTEMEREPCDVLGRLYMELELGNERLGQYYTPYDIAQLMAEMQIDSVVEQVQRDGFADVYEPSCGAGAFMVALSQAMFEHSLNPQTQLHVTAEDIAPQALHMIYVHLTLLHIPAVVRRRNVLTLETFDTWPAPAHVLGGWSRRLRLAHHGAAAAGPGADDPAGRSGRRQCPRVAVRRGGRQVDSVDRPELLVGDPHRVFGSSAPFSVATHDGMPTR